MPKLIAGILVSLILGITACATKLQKENPMNTSPSTLWQLIEKLGAHSSLAPDKIKQVLPTDFSERLRYPNTVFYNGGPLQLADQININAINLRVRLMNETQGMVTLNIAGVCVTLEQVWIHYPDMVITDHPRGHSLDEETYWSAYLSWGKLSFGFKERNPECLASVVINRRDPLPTPRYQHPPM